jgi:Ca2+-binding EF-hand superfamily protein
MDYIEIIIIIIIISIIGNYIGNYMKIDKKSGIETIVIIRHGEKPDTDLGNLSCKGFNRAKALPEYFEKNFPKPDYIFASKTLLRSKKNKTPYYYIRPLITIAPTAIKNKLPVNVGFPAGDPFKAGAMEKSSNDLINELLKEKYRSSTIFIAWEHLNIPVIAELLLKKFNKDTSNIPNNEKNFKITDIDKSGNINFNEFIELFKDTSEIISNEELKKIFNELDRDNNNSINNQEFATWEREDFDSVYILEIDWNTNDISFKIDNQNLNNINNSC